MDIANKYDIEWEAVNPHDSQITMNLDVAVTDFLDDPTDIEGELERSSDPITDYITEEFLKVHIPKIISSSNQEVGSHHTTVKHNIRIKSQHENGVEEGRMISRNRMLLKIALQSEEAASPITALFVARLAVARAIADNIVSGMRNCYLGETENTTQFQARTVDDTPIPKDRLN